MRLPGALRTSLRGKLLAAHLLVILVGVVTLLFTTSLVAQDLFDRSMLAMMGPGGRGPGGMMGQGGRMAMMDAAMDEIIGQAFREAVVQSLAISTALAIATAVGASFFVSGRIAGSVARMLAASRRIAAGHYAERVPEGSQDELGQLAASFNSMASALEATERRRLELIGDVAHELRTPIANLEGYLEGLLDGVVEPSDRTWAFLHGEAGRLRRLVDDLGELSRAEARQIPISPRPVAPERLVEAAVERFRPQFAEKGVALEVALPAGLPAVLADEDRVVQVLGNLLGNALRYTPSDGRVTVDAVQNDGAVAFRVSDTGVGVAAEDLPHLFERFYRVEKSRSRAGGGSGIGLTIARALVEAQGGRIWAESPGPGRGSTFTFTLPLAR